MNNLRKQFANKNGGVKTMDFQVLERNAKLAKHMNSFNDYKDGSATAEYNQHCAHAEEVAIHAKEKLEQAKAPIDRSEKVDYLLGVYKQKKFDWLVSLYANSASCPSVMISGAGNFPVRRKEKQIAREKALYDEDPEYLLDKMREVGNNSGTIYSDDKNAVERIKEKIEWLKANPDRWGNNSAEIRRLKERLLVLAPEEFAEQQANISINGAKTFEEIVALWANGTRTVSHDGLRFYWNLPLVFTDGKRKYSELVQIEIDEQNENILRYNLDMHKTEALPLTDNRKYALIINEISGSGNKAVIHQHLKNLSPITQEQKAKAAEAEQNGQTVTINGEEAEVKRNKEDMRLQLLFNRKPEDKTREILKENGFRWAPSASAWQRLLNDNAEWALKRICDKKENGTQTA
jgi:hypothetical protein